MAIVVTNEAVMKVDLDKVVKVIDKVIEVFYEDIKDQGVDDYTHAEAEAKVLALRVAKARIIKEAEKGNLE